MYVCVCVCVCVCWCVCMYVCVLLRMYVCMRMVRWILEQTILYVCMYVCCCVCMYAYGFKQCHALIGAWPATRPHVCMYASHYVCMYLTMYVCMSTYLNKSKNKLVFDPSQRMRARPRQHSLQARTAVHRRFHISNAGDVLCRGVFAEKQAQSNDSNTVVAVWVRTCGTK
jgi:hypothetical protein